MTIQMNPWQQLDLNRRARVALNPRNQERHLQLSSSHLGFDSLNPLRDLVRCTQPNRYLSIHSNLGLQPHHLHPKPRTRRLYSGMMGKL
jgi:hypothetical protein